MAAFGVATAMRVRQEVLGAAQPFQPEKSDKVSVTTFLPRRLFEIIAHLECAMMSSPPKDFQKSISSVPSIVRP